MRNPVKILHIDSNYQVHYLIFQESSSIRSTVSLEVAIALLKSIEFDLILSEPHNKAIIRKGKEMNLNHNKSNAVGL
jgi:hypothetical protein